MSHIVNVLQRTTPKEEYLGFVDGFRFIAILAVIFFHFRAPFQDRYPSVAFDDAVEVWPFMKTGGRGVDIFFVLSAFILGVNLFRNNKKQSWGSFYKRRLYRIYPPFFVAMLLIFCGNLWVTKEFAFRELFPSLLATLGYLTEILSPYVQLPVLCSVTWTLEIEIQFYLLFPLLGKVYGLSPKVRRGVLLAGIVLFTILSKVFPLPFVSVYDFLPLFFAGMLLADLYFFQVGTDFPPFFLFVVAISSFALIFYCIPAISVNLPGALVWPFVLFLFFFCCVRNHVLISLLSKRIITLIGGMCYSIYLTHASVISLCAKYMGTRPICGVPFLDRTFWFSILLCFILIVAVFFYVFIEKPFTTAKRNY